MATVSQFNLRLKRFDTWLPATKDKDKTVRTTVLANLRGRVAELTDNQIGELVASPYKDIRVFAGQCLINASDLDLQDLGLSC